MGSKLLIADQTIDKEINQLREDPSKLIGMENPETGIWLHVVYYWKFFWNIIWELLGNIILIFFPLTLIYSIMSLIDKSKVAKNILISSLIFIIYLVLVNSIMLTHSALKGNSFITLPENLDIFHEYLFLSMKVLPFHGLINLATYLFKIIIIT
jgi:ABC-type multidrug transport system fused ATPase/permease subunit